MKFEYVKLTVLLTPQIIGWYIGSRELYIVNIKGGKLPVGINEKGATRAGSSGVREHLKHGHFLPAVFRQQAKHSSISPGRVH
jgi:hypothetical protein